MEGIVYKTQGTSDLTDDVLINVGSPVGTILQARGIASGDRLCAFDTHSTTPRLGCLEDVPLIPASLPLLEVPDWQPDITIQSVNTSTILVTVTQPITEGILRLQIFPTTAPITTAFDISAPVKTMTPITIGSDTFTQKFAFPYLLFGGYARVWLTSRTTSAVTREAVSSFFFTPSWNGDRYGWGGDKSYGWKDNRYYGWHGNEKYGWAANSHNWNAPIASPNGQVILFDTTNILGHNNSSFTTLQALTIPPPTPPWLTLVGEAYHYKTKAALHLDNLVIQFQYLQRELPFVQESQLHIYHSADDGLSWRRLEDTSIDVTRNLASASISGPGMYALMAGIKTPVLNQGWNLFAYPNVNTRTVDIALASIEGDYSIVYRHDHDDKWKLYASDIISNFASIVNNLEQLDPLQTYWIHALTDTVPYIKPSEETTSLPSGFQVPPATFYGWVTPTIGIFTPTEGMQITAEINGIACGQTTIQSLNGKLAYVLPVQSESTLGNGLSQCGATGRPIVFRVGNRVMEQVCRWDSTHAWYHPLITIPAPTANNGNTPHACNNYQIWFPLFHKE